MRKIQFDENYLQEVYSWIQCVIAGIHFIEKVSEHPSRLIDDFINNIDNNHDNNKSINNIDII